MQRFGRVYDSVALHRLAPRARAMRIAPTRSEDILWQALRRGALGVRFRRQVVLGPFIVDFFAPSVGLVVEVDGAIHLGQRDADRVRDAGLRGLGLRVLRLGASQVEERLQSSLDVIRSALQAVTIE